MAQATTPFARMTDDRLPHDAPPISGRVVQFSYDGTDPPPPYSAPTTPPPVFAPRRRTISSVVWPVDLPLRHHAARQLHPADVIQEGILIGGRIRPAETYNRTTNSRRRFYGLDARYLVVLACIMTVAFFVVVGWVAFHRKSVISDSVCSFGVGF